MGMRGMWSSAGQQTNLQQCKRSLQGHEGYVRLETSSDVHEGHARLETSSDVHKGHARLETSRAGP